MKLSFLAPLLCVSLIGHLTSCAPLTLPEDLSKEARAEGQEVAEEEKESALEVYFRLKRLREREQAVLPGSEFCARYIVYFAKKCQIFNHRQFAVQAKLLRHVTDFWLDLLGFIFEV